MSQLKDEEANFTQTGRRFSRQTMQRQRLIEIVGYTTFVILLYVFVRLLSLNGGQSDDVDATQVRTRRFSRYGFVFPSSFNRSCTSPFLDLPQTLVKPCAAAGANASTQTFSACTRLTCRNLLRSGDPELHALADNFTSGLTRTPITNGDIVRETENCAAFRRRRGFRDVVDPETADFPLAYNILAHSNPNQLVRLLRAIYRPHNVICIHVDSKASQSFHSAVESLRRCFYNVRLASRMESVVWGGYSRLQADITCMKDHVQAGGNWKYLINTAALAYPLRTVEETARILRTYNGANDVEGIFGKRVLRGRFENEWLELTEMRRIRKTGRLNAKPPHNIDIVRGSAYAVFSRRFVTFIVRDARARDLLEWSRRTWSPDEFYWATLHHTYANPHLHTPGGYPGYPSSKPWLAVYANWGEERCHGRSVRGVCVFGVGDLPLLLNRLELFANKLYDDYQPLALDCLEAWIRHKEVCPPNDDFDYYRQLPFVLPD